MSILSFILELVQGGEVMELEGLITVLARHPRPTPTLPTELVAHVVHRASKVTAAVHAPKQIILPQVVRSIATQVTAARGDSRFADALSILCVTGSHAPYCAWDVAVTGITA